MIRILTENNTSFHMNDIPNEVDDLRYCVLDYSDSKDPDYYFIPMIFLDTFPYQVVDLKIGPYKIQLPSDWSIVIGDKHLGDLEIIELSKLNDREFTVFSFNPISGYRAKFHSIEIIDVYPDIKWFFPKLKFGHLLAIPLEDKVGADCVFVVKETNRISEILDISKII